MNKKILDATATCAFCICLAVAPNIQERRVAEAGSFGHVYVFPNSFTTESDEETGSISRNETVRVTASGEIAAEAADVAADTKMPEASVAAAIEMPTTAGKAEAAIRMPVDAGKTAAAAIEMPAAAGTAEAAIRMPAVTGTVETAISMPAGTAEPVEDAAAVMSEQVYETAPAELSEQISEMPSVVETEQIYETAAAPQIAGGPELLEGAPQQFYQNRWGITALTDEEKELLARILWLEARGEPETGREAVVEVIFNRIASASFPGSVYEVLSQRNPVQFSSWKDREKAAPGEAEYQTIENVLNGNTAILRNDTLYFSRSPLTSRVDARIGAHSFCY